MEKLSQDCRYEQKENLKSNYCIPVVDVLRDTEQTGRTWPEFADELCPQVEKHAESARRISEYLDDLERGGATMAEKERFYDSVCDLLDNPEQERIALFLPFESFPTPDEQSYEARHFRESYLSAWGNLLQVQDVRASFVDGDVLEVGARPGDPERVIKAAHLAPWLVQSGMLQVSDIIALASEGDDELLTRGLLETRGLLSDMSLLSEEDETALSAIESGLPEKSPLAPPRYITPARQTWLAEKARGLERPTEPPDNVDLGSPLGSRLDSLKPELEVAEQFAADLDPAQTYGVVWLGGSRLKGYNQHSSDLDLFVPTRVRSDKINGAYAIPVPEIIQDLPSHAHEVFDMVWVGNADKIQQLQREIAPEYFTEKNTQTRKWVMERLEQDLLEYRLLHKGYPRLYPDANPEYKKYISMDGQSAFYERGYRIIATKIFANSIFMPRI